METRPTVVDAMRCRVWKLDLQVVDAMKCRVWKLDLQLLVLRGVEYGNSTYRSLMP